MDLEHPPGDQHPPEVQSASKGTEGSGLKDGKMLRRRLRRKVGYRR